MQIIRQNESFLLLRRLGRGVAEVLKQAEFKRETEGMKEMLREAKEELGFEASCWNYWDIWVHASKKDLL